MKYNDLFREVHFMLMRPAYLTIHKDSKSVMRHSSGDITDGISPTQCLLSCTLGGTVHPRDTDEHFPNQGSEDFVETELRSHGSHRPLEVDQNSAGTTGFLRRTCHRAKGGSLWVGLPFSGAFWGSRRPGDWPCKRTPDHQGALSFSVRLRD